MSKKTGKNNTAREKITFDQRENASFHMWLRDHGIDPDEWLAGINVEEFEEMMEEQNVRANA